jgi:Pyridine nucleotide-disulphide oxidoreductase
MTHGALARPVVVVLGGGYAGVQVARPLDDLADVVLVEPKDHFVHNVAALRALVDPSWLERIYLPYTGLLGAGQVIKDRAVKADADRVVLASGAELFPDYLVLATGSGYPFPAKPDLPGTGDAHGKVRSTHGVRRGRPGAAARCGPGRHRARRGDQGGLAGQAGDAGRRGRRRAGERYRPDLKAELRRQLAGLAPGCCWAARCVTRRRPRPASSARSR